MKSAIINGSPKAKGNSNIIALEIEKQLQEIQPNFIHQISNHGVQEWSSYDTLVFVFPLYIDAIPSHLFKAMCEYAHNPKKSQKIYVVVNCGFYEANQNILALDIFENWCNEVGLLWCGGIGVGAGEMLGATKDIPIGKGPHRKLEHAIVDLCESIKHSRSMPITLISPYFPRFAYRIASTYTKWIPMARKNKISRREIRKYN